MAACGAKFTEEKEERQTDDERKTVDHSLNNVVAFSTKKMQYSANSREGLLVSDKDGFKDSRIRIDYDKAMFDLLSFKAVSQMKASLSSGVPAVGSCGLVLIDNKNYIMTCAHNLTSYSTYHDRFINHKNPYAYTSRNGENKWQSLWEVDEKNIKIHPKYSGDPCSGFDFAIAPVEYIPHPNSGKVSFPKVKDSGYMCVSPENLRIGLKIELVGYPGEKKGHPYYSKGQIKAIKNKSEDGWIMYYNADSTPGMSGSEILMVDEGWINEHITNANESGIKKVTIGVHTGHDHTVMLNFGTLMTPTLERWMETGKMGNKMIEKAMI